MTASDDHHKLLLLLPSKTVSSSWWLYSDYSNFYKGQTKSKHSDAKSFSLYNSLRILSVHTVYQLQKDPFNVSSNQNQDKEERSCPTKWNGSYQNFLFPNNYCNLAFSSSLNTYKHAKTIAPAIFSSSIDKVSFEWHAWRVTSSNYECFPLSNLDLPGIFNRTYHHLNEMDS